MALTPDDLVLPVVLGPIGCWEDLQNLPGFQNELPAKLMKTGIPLKPYSMPKKGGERRCGIAECRTNHRHGYVIQVGAQLSNVGHRCAAKYFGRSEWKAHIRQLRKTESERAAKEALQQAREAAKALVNGTSARPDGYAEVEAWLALFETLPYGLRGELGERAHHLQPEIVQKREPTAEEIRQAKFHGRPRPITVEVKVGNIAGIRAVAQNSRADAVSKRLVRQKSELLALAESGSATTEQINNAVALLNQSVGLLDTAMSRAREFFAESNWREIDKLRNGAKFREIFGQQKSGDYRGAA